MVYFITYLVLIFQCAILFSNCSELSSSPQSRKQHDRQRFPAVLKTSRILDSQTQSARFPDAVEYSDSGRKRPGKVFDVPVTESPKITEFLESVSSKKRELESGTRIVYVKAEDLALFLETGKLPQVTYSLPELKETLKPSSPRHERPTEVSTSNQGTRTVSGLDKGQPKSRWRFPDEQPTRQEPVIRDDVKPTFTEKPVFASGSWKPTSPSTLEALLGDRTKRPRPSNEETNKEYQAINTPTQFSYQPNQKPEPNRRPSKLQDRPVPERPSVYSTEKPIDLVPINEPSKDYPVNTPTQFSYQSNQNPEPNRRPSTLRDKPVAERPLVHSTEKPIDLVPINEPSKDYPVNTPNQFSYQPNQKLEPNRRPSTLRDRPVAERPLVYSTEKPLDLVQSNKDGYQVDTNRPVVPTSPNKYSYQSYQKPSSVANLRPSALEDKPLVYNTEKPIELVPSKEDDYQVYNQRPLVPSNPNRYQSNRKPSAANLRPSALEEKPVEEQPLIYSTEKPIELVPSDEDDYQVNNQRPPVPSSPNKYNYQSYRKPSSAGNLRPSTLEDKPEEEQPLGYSTEKPTELLPSNEDDYQVNTKRPLVPSRPSKYSYQSYQRPPSVANLRPSNTEKPIDLVTSKPKLPVKPAASLNRPEEPTYVSKIQSDPSVKGPTGKVVDLQGLREFYGSIYSKKPEETEPEWPVLGSGTKPSAPRPSVYLRAANILHAHGLQQTLNDVVDLVEGLPQRPSSYKTTLNIPRDPPSVPIQAPLKEPNFKNPPVSLKTGPFETGLIDPPKKPGDYNVPKTRPNYPVPTGPENRPKTTKLDQHSSPRFPPLPILEPITTGIVLEPEGNVPTKTSEEDPTSLRKGSRPSNILKQQEIKPGSRRPQTQPRFPPLPILEPIQTEPEDQNPQQYLPLRPVDPSPEDKKTPSKDRATQYNPKLRPSSVSTPDSFRPSRPYSDGPRQPVRPPLLSLEPIQEDEDEEEDPVNEDYEQSDKNPEQNYEVLDDSFFSSRPEEPDPIELVNHRATGLVDGLKDLHSTVKVEDNSPPRASSGSQKEEVQGKPQFPPLPILEPIQTEDPTGNVLFKSSFDRDRDMSPLAELQGSQESSPSVDEDRDSEPQEPPTDSRVPLSGPEVSGDDVSLDEESVQPEDPSLQLPYLETDYQTTKPIFRVSVNPKVLLRPHGVQHATSSQEPYSEEPNLGNPLSISEESDAFENGPELRPQEGPLGPTIPTPQHEEEPVVPTTFKPSHFHMSDFNNEPSENNRPTFTTTALIESPKAPEEPLHEPRVPVGPPRPKPQRLNAKVPKRKPKFDFTPKGPFPSPAPRPRDPDRAKSLLDKPLNRPAPKFDGFGTRIRPLKRSQPSPDSQKPSEEDRTAELGGTETNPDVPDINLSPSLDSPVIPALLSETKDENSGFQVVEPSTVLSHVGNNWDGNQDSNIDVPGTVPVNSSTESKPEASDVLSPPKVFVLELNGAVNDSQKTTVRGFKYSPRNSLKSSSYRSLPKSRNGRERENSDIVTASSLYRSYSNPKFTVSRPEYADEEEMEVSGAEYLPYHQEELVISTSESENSDFTETESALGTSESAENEHYVTDTSQKGPMKFFLLRRKLSPDSEEKSSVVFATDSLPEALEDPESLISLLQQR